MAEPPPFLLCLLLFVLPSLSHSQLINPIDLSSLVSIKSTLRDRPGSTFFSTWNFSESDPCSTFTGILCSETRVISLTLGTGLSDSPGLTGTLSPSLSNLSSLTQLILFSGTVTGTIPTQLGTLQNLRVISLSKNRLLGPIPDSLTTLPNLHTLDLSFNQLTGSISPTLTTLPSLKVLILSSNKLSGELPDITTQLLHLDLKNNRFSGQLPLSLPSSLHYLSLSQNQLWGPLDRLDSLSELVYLDLSMNQFNGTIPDSLLLSKISSLFLQRNNLTGQMPTLPLTGTSLDFDKEGRVVDLSHNALSGELTSALAGVENLYLNNNRLLGNVPIEYVESVSKGNMKTLYLQHNYLSGFPLEPGTILPELVCLCLSYNCMDLPSTGFSNCPSSAGVQLSRPVYQCGEIYNGTKNGT